jgi:predicted  nucleic acid-binding Zn-ribbon protein
MEQLSTLGVILGNPNSTTKAFANRKEELAREKNARETAHAEVEALTQAVGDLKMLANRFAAQIPVLQDKVKHLDNKVIDRLNEL